MLIEALIALVLAVGLGLLCVNLFRVRGPWTAPWAMFLLLFLMIWAGGVWIVPFGPAVGGVVWQPFLVVAVLAVLLFSAGSPPARGVHPADARAEQAASTVAIGLSAFFWVFVLALILALALRYA